MLAYKKVGWSYAFGRNVYRLLNFLDIYGNNNLLKENQFTVLRKCQGKFDCLVFEMLFIKNLKPNLNIQTDIGLEVSKSIRFHDS